MLSRRDWVTLNRFRTNVGMCKSILTKWEVINDAKCDCGAQIHTMHHIFNKCLLTNYENGLEDLRKVYIYQ